MTRGTLRRPRQEVDLLLAMRLVEPDPTHPYRLTALGAFVRERLPFIRPD